MNQPSNKQEKQEQKAILSSLYNDYNYIRHDAFVERYNKEAEQAQLEDYLVNRGLLKTRKLHHSEWAF